MGIQRLWVREILNSFQQVNGEFALKEATLVEYRTAVQKLIKSFPVYNLRMSLKHKRSTWMP